MCDFSHGLKILSPFSP